MTTYSSVAVERLERRIASLEAELAAAEAAVARLETELAEAKKHAEEVVSYANRMVAKADVFELTAWRQRQALQEAERKLAMLRGWCALDTGSHPGFIAIADIQWALAGSEGTGE